MYQRPNPVASRNAVAQSRTYGARDRMAFRNDFKAAPTIEDIDDNSWMNHWRLIEAGWGWHADYESCHTAYLDAFLDCRLVYRKS
jgi:hypothetical protein